MKSMKRTLLVMAMVIALAMSMMAPAMADGHPPPTGEGQCTAAGNIVSNPGLHKGVPDHRADDLEDLWEDCKEHFEGGLTHPGGNNPNYGG